MGEHIIAMMCYNKRNALKFMWYLKCNVVTIKNCVINYI